MTSFLPSAREREQARAAAGLTSFDTENLALQGLALILGVIAGVDHQPVKSAGYGLQAVVEGLKGKESRGADALKKLGKKANPFFTANDVEVGTESPVTQRYLTTRRWKKMAGSAFQMVGDLASLAAPPANVPGAILHGQAAGLTGMHLLGLAAIAVEYRNAEVVAGWCKLIASMKMMKLGVRSTQLASAFVPAASLPASVIAALMKAGIKNLTLTGACYAAAAQIHWIAYNEQGHYQRGEPPAPPTVGRPPMPPMPPMARNRPLPPQKPVPTGPLPLPPLVPNRRPPSLVEAAVTEGPDAGPASKIIWEIFTRRGATRLLGAYEIGTLIKEPAGWMALGDKLMLI